MVLNYEIKGENGKKVGFETFWEGGRERNDEENEREIKNIVKN